MASIESVADESNPPGTRIPCEERLNERARNLILMQTAHDAADETNMFPSDWAKLASIDLQRQHLERQLPPVRMNVGRVKI